MVMNIKAYSYKKITLLFNFENNLNAIYFKNKIKIIIFQKCLFTGPITLISTLSRLLKCIRF